MYSVLALGRIWSVSKFAAMIFFFFQAEDGIRDSSVTGVQTCALPIFFPLRARSGGTLERRGHTEAAVDLMRIAGLAPGAVICEILGDDGESARGAQLLEMARRWQLSLLSADAITGERASPRARRFTGA